MWHDIKILHVSVQLYFAKKKCFILLINCLLVKLQKSTIRVLLVYMQLQFFLINAPLQ